MIKDRSSYCLDISEENYKLLIRHFGLQTCLNYAHSSPTSFDVVPTYRDGAINGFQCSLFLAHFFGMYLTYDAQSTLAQGICWTGEKLMPLIQSALLHLKQLAQHPHYALLASSATFNTYHDYRIAAVNEEVASVEKRTGYRGWDVIAYDPAKGSFNELSARMSGLIISLSANRRLNSIAAEMLATTEMQDLRSSFNSWGIPPPTISSFEDHVRTIQRRMRVQNTSIELVITRVKNQLTAVRDSIMIRSVGWTAHS
jgi:hypothetical protein